MNVSEVLNTAADLIEQRGWTTGTDGWSHRANKGPLCIEGALQLASGEKRNYDLMKSCPAVRAVAAYVGATGDGGNCVYNLERPDRRVLRVPHRAHRRRGHRDPPRRRAHRSCPHGRGRGGSGMSAPDFGCHVPASIRDKGPQSPIAVFTRGLRVPGQQWKFHFANGYGASVINDGYGAEAGLYELAVIGLDGKISYDTHLTSYVMGCLTEAQVVEALDAIEALPAEVTA
jgi:hypothetical protein